MDRAFHQSTAPSSPRMRATLEGQFRMGFRQMQSGWFRDQQHWEHYVQVSLDALQTMNEHNDMYSLHHIRLAAWGTTPNATVR